MNPIIPNGFVSRVLDFIGYKPILYHEQYIAYLGVILFFVVSAVLLSCLIFRLICYIKR